MKLFKSSIKQTGLLTVLVLMVASCANSQSLVNTPKAKISPSLKVSCSDPTTVPKRDLTRSEVVENWNKDRSNLRICKDRHGALVDQIKIIEEGEIK